MIKKLLFLFFLSTFSLSALAQQNETSDKTESVALIKDIIATPNPFSVTTKIRFIAISEFEVEFSVKDLIGNVVYIQKYTTKKGANSIPFYRDKLDSGIYIYSIKTNSEIISKRIVIK